MIHCRSLITGLISFVAAPAIVRASSLMPIKAIDPTCTIEELVNRRFKVILEYQVRWQTHWGELTKQLTHNEVSTVRAALL